MAPNRFPFISRIAASFAGRLAALHPSKETRAIASFRARFDLRQWTPGLLRQLEWRRFEELVVAYYQTIGFTTHIGGAGEDGSVDITLHAKGAASPASLARCKAWDAYRVGAKAVKELRAAASAAKIAEATLLTSGRFTQDALALAAAEKVETVDGDGLLLKLAALPPAQSASLLAFATAGDFLTPTCPRCSLKMVARKSTRGGRKFWGCTNYPSCKHTIFASAPA
jgi:restriction system protein